MELKFHDKVINNYLPAPVDDKDNSDGSYIRLGVDGALINGAVMNTGTYYGAGSIFTGIGCGTNAFERIGRKIVIKSLQIAGHFAANVENDEEDSVPMKCWLILDKQANGQYPKIGDIFMNENGNSATTIPGNTYDITVNTLANIANKQRFVILKEWEWNSTPPSTWTNPDDDVLSPATTKHIRYYKRCNIPIEYGGTTGAIGEIKSNNVFLVFAATKKSANTQSPYFDLAMRVRIRYNDS